MRRTIFRWLMAGLFTGVVFTAFPSRVHGSTEMLVEQAPWSVSVYLGGEFPGAKGTKDQIEDPQLGPSLRVDYDFSGGGRYLGLLFGGVPEVETQALLFSFKGFGGQVRLWDSTGQVLACHFEGPKDGQWKAIEVPLTAGAFAEAHWGGANDGQIHFPLRMFLIGVDAHDPAKDFFQLAKVAVRVDKAAPGTGWALQVKTGAPTGVAFVGEKSPYDFIVENRVRQAIQKANQVVHQYAVEKPGKAADAGTTVTMAVVQGQWVVIANVGDSRTYLLRNHKLRQLTQDHSLVASMVASGQIRPEEIFVHPQRNVIYRSLGQKRQVQIDTFRETLEAGDHLLLCSDGLWEMVQDEAVMARLVDSAKTPTQACQILVDAANTAGGEDNIGVVLVRVS